MSWIDLPEDDLNNMENIVFEMASEWYKNGYSEEDMRCAIHKTIEVAMHRAEINYVMGL